MLNFQSAHLPKIDKRNNKASIEPTVIDEILIIKSVKDYNAENKITMGDQIMLNSLRVMSLSFKNIWKIENLQGLERLEKLQLDNNIIQKIENLDHLVNLHWLDLSFNLIKEIEGLDKLVNLKDLSMFNNQLTSVGGLDNCKSLNVLSIGNNKIPSFEIVTQYFSKGKGMKFKNLQVLNVAGNPFTKEPDYKNHIINSLPNLRYLDYSFIDEAQRNQIRESDEKFRTDAITQEDFLKQMQNQEQEEKNNNDELFKRKSARMDLVEKLSDELIQDEELEKVKTMKGVEEEINKFQEKIKETVENLQKNVIQKNTAKLQSIEKFEQAVRAREIKSENETILTIKKFEHQKKLAFRAKERNEEGWKQKLEDLEKETQKLKDNLLSTELQLMVDIEAALGDFDGKLGFITKDMSDYVSGDHGFKKIGDFIREFGTKLTDIAKLEYDRYQIFLQQGSDLSEWDEDLQTLFENKETLLGTVSNIKDNLQSKANTKDTNITTSIERDIKLLVTSYKEKQYERNRKNVLQINKQIEDYTDQIKNQQTPSDDESEGN
ncbi:unnamed protein product [Paramecium pentaurelia]|uniref:Uncharacterized protein n=1 Tax=Paramecium pentaurelia TaxID=43138 RepID=A0A8S1VW40_9CILI|nr:unnamed protein product [Paramecium pentaurelia]